MMVFWFFFGWFVFVVFGGIGLVAFPLDLILDYFYRPRPRSAAELAERKIILRRKCEELMSYTDSLTYSLDNLDDKKSVFTRWSAKRKHGKKENYLEKEMV